MEPVGLAVPVLLTEVKVDLEGPVGVADDAEAETDAEAEAEAEADPLIETEPEAKTEALNEPEGLVVGTALLLALPPPTLEKAVHCEVAPAG